MAPRASILLATRNLPRLLDLVLEGYARQSCVDFELLIADDGSGPKTREVIDRHTRRFPTPIVHVWQPDEGYRRAEAMNRAAIRSRAEWLLFSRGDCIPSRTFVEEHLAASGRHTYAVGGHIGLAPEHTAEITRETVRSGAFESLGTRAERLRVWSTHLKSLAYITFDARREPKLQGLSLSVDRESFFRVNGFDHTYRERGREDSDLRSRMQLAGVRARSLWHRGRVFHLHGPTRDAQPAPEEDAEYRARPDLEAEAAFGLRELESEGRAAVRRPKTPPPLRAV
jgi:glycosyltransferase involved in cell wall biosynthesis